MPLQIRERPPKKFNVVKPRNTTTEKMGMKKTAGSVKPETLQSVSKKARQGGRDLGGAKAWRAPSDSHNDGSTRIEETMNKSYEDHFFKINRGHNRGSVRPTKKYSAAINGADFFK